MPAPIQIGRPHGLVCSGVDPVSNRSAQGQQAVVPAQLEGLDRKRLVLLVVGNLEDAAVDRCWMGIEGDKKLPGAELDLAFPAKKCALVADVETRLPANGKIDEL